MGIGFASLDDGIIHDTKGCQTIPHIVFIITSLKSDFLIRSDIGFT